MLDPQASRFWQAALQSGLVDAEALTTCWNAIPAGKREAPEHIDRRLARQAVQSRALTLWQAQQLLAGRTSGYRVDRYTLLDLIGQGGMGRVYLARDTRLNRRVALKILSPERVNNPRAIARFQREARVGAQLEHENLVRIYDFGEANGRYYLVMEYIEGKTIGTMISEQGAVSLAITARLVRQIALGLEHAHRKGLIHRDVNPYNVLVTRDGIAKLADLGLAIDLMDEERVTREGATVGTFDYVAPEQARQSHAADIRSDIYSLGCTFYHMSTGQVPFPSPSLPEKLFAHQALEPVPIEQLIPRMPEQLSEVVRRMMRKSPDERYAAPVEVAVALEPYIDESALATSVQHALSGQSETTAERLSHGSSEPLMVISGAPELARALAKTMGEASIGMMNAGASPTATVQSKTPHDVASPSRPNADIQASDPEHPLYLDLGTEPLLHEGLPRLHSKPMAHYPTTAVTRFVRAYGSVGAWLARAWLGALVTISVTVSIWAVMLALTNLLSTPPKVSQVHHPGTTNVQPIPSIESKTTQPRIPPAIDVEAELPIVVRKEGEEDVKFGPSRLLQAMQTAMGKEGWVELRNRSPLRVSSDQAGDLASGRGRLIIRAAIGIQPILDVEVKSNRPFLSAGSAVPIELTGVTLIVHYPKADLPASKTADLAPLIVAATTAKIERCAFKVAGSVPVRRLPHCTRAADRCWLIAAGFTALMRPSKSPLWAKHVRRLSRRLSFARLTKLRRRIRTDGPSSLAAPKQSQPRA